MIWIKAMPEEYFLPFFRLFVLFVLCLVLFRCLKRLCRSIVV